MKLGLHPISLAGTTLSLGAHLTVFGVLFTAKPDPIDIAVHLVNIKLEASQALALQPSEPTATPTDFTSPKIPIRKPSTATIALPVTTAISAPLSIAIISPTEGRATKIKDVSPPTVNAMPQSKAAPRTKPAPHTTEIASLDDSSGVVTTDALVPVGSGKTIGARIAVGRNAQPRYPLAARKRGYEGRAIIRAKIGPSGNVLRTEIAQSSGHQMLDTIAQKAVTEWTFRPALRDGRAVLGQIEVPIEFRLQ